MRLSNEAADDLDEVFSILSNRRRRRVLATVEESDGSVTLGRLADVLAAMESGDGETAESVSGQPRKRVYISLRQTHIPAMEDAELIEWDRDRNVVHTTAKANRAFRALEEFADTYIPGDEKQSVWNQFRRSFQANG